MPSVYRPFKLIICLLAVAVAGGLVSVELPARCVTETKIRLMADALRARDSGDLGFAQRNLFELPEMVLGDPAV